MRKFKFLAAVCCMAAVFTAMSITFVSCKKEKTDDPKDPTVYTLTVLSSNEEMGTVTGGGSYEEGTEVTLTATPTSEEYAFVKWSDENTDNPRALTVAGDLELTAIFDYAAVDLGLSVKWATCNVGATTPEAYGDYYAWGETETKETYEWSNYKWCDGNYDAHTKYCNNASYGKDGFTDSKTVLDLEDDAARANWGGAWRTPTKEEWQELIDNCTWTWTENYKETGIKGYEVKATNENSIFLPAAGYHDDDNLLYDGTNCSYWSSSLSTEVPGAYGVDCKSGSVLNNYGARRCGLSVRPVLGE